MSLNVNKLVDTIMVRILDRFISRLLSVFFNYATPMSTRHRNCCHAIVFGYCVLHSLGICSLFPEYCTMYSVH